MEYSGEDETISAVGIVHPKSGIFVEAIQHLLVVCTTIEVKYFSTEAHATHACPANSERVVLAAEMGRPKRGFSLKSWIVLCPAGAAAGAMLHTR